MMARFLPHGIAGQLALLLIVSVALFHLVLSALFFGFGAPRRPVPPDVAHHRQQAALWLIDRAKPDERPDLMAALVSEDPELRFRVADTATAAAIDWSASGPGRAYRGETIGSGTGTVPSTAGETAGSVDMAFRLRDGTVLIGSGSWRPPPMFGGPVFVTVAILAICLLVLGIWAARSLTAPLRSFSRAVETFGREDTTPVMLTEQGPVEVRAAASAFNRMQARIDDLVQDRTRMLAAVGHDLRTPVTRLRLRADYVADHSLRDAVLADLDHMDGLLRGALSYLQSGQSGEKTVPVDLSSLLQTIADQWADSGVIVPCSGPSRVQVSGRPSELLRLFGNLVENAVRHGGGGEIILMTLTDEEAVNVAIVDHGPGIPEDAHQAMLEPFVRGDAARNMDQAAGFGLGLAICVTLARGHGGTLELTETPGGGLTVRVRLPRGGGA